MPQNRTHESGNVFLFIMLGVVLFATLSFTVARGFRSDTSTAMSNRQADLAASDILNYAQRMTRAIDRARRNGCSESEINFDNDVIAGYDNTSAPVSGKCDVFSSRGGPVPFWDTSTQSIHIGSTTAFYQQQFITGNLMHHPSAGNTANVELTLWIPDINAQICAAINDQLDITDIPDGTAETLGGTLFTGSFGTSADADREIVAVGGELVNQMTGCMEIDTTPGDDINAFYSVLLAR